jgi:hypothetical protein
MPRLTPLSDLARLLARLCLKAADQARNDVHSCVLPEAGGPQISSANLFDFRNIRKCGKLRICKLRTMYFFHLRICDLRTQLFKTSANPQIHKFSADKEQL